MANIFFYRKGDTTIMIDAGYNYDRLAEKMGWLGIALADIRHILITHQDTDHVGAVEADSLGLFRDAKLYIGEIENRYLTGAVRRRVSYHLYKLPQLTIPNERVLLQDGQIFMGTGHKITYEPNMEDYLLCHAAFVLPAVFACYYTDGDLRKLKGNTAYLNRDIRQFFDKTGADYSTWQALERDAGRYLK